VDFLKKKKEMNAKGSKTDKIKRAGFPRFKNIDRVKSLHYPQSGFCLKEKLKVSPFGEINIKKHREMKGKIKTLTLKKEPSGKWYAIFTAEEEPKPISENNGTQVGIDLGLINFAVFSDGKTIKNPRHLKKHEEKLKKKDYKLSKKKKGSKNSKKEKRKSAVVHEKVKHIRKDFLHKLSKELVYDHSLIVLEDLSIQDMAQENYGKSINDAGWSEFANMLAYKAESAGCRVMFVNPKNTTKECSDCRSMIEKELWERQHNCPSCGLSMNRDLNAAINILKRAILSIDICDVNFRQRSCRSTAGSAGSNACGDEVIVSSLKQEAQALTC
jgi:putative transposase